MSSAEGSSLAAFFCATSMMLLPASMAASSALIDFGLPTNKGMTMCGNTTTSRNGRSGSTVGSNGNKAVDIWAILTAQCRANGDNPRQFKKESAGAYGRSTLARHPDVNRPGGLGGCTPFVRATLLPDIEFRISAAPLRP